mmetsp:Transcript_100006/g.168832  ORF Transcript_100006/g.168832 Transcript_100006/m.168832 type:complete len:109 (-) Transcript_100006:1396-1722(-)
MVLNLVLIWACIKVAHVKSNHDPTEQGFSTAHNTTLHASHTPSNVMQPHFGSNTPHLTLTTTSHHTLQEPHIRNIMKYTNKCTDPSLLPPCQSIAGGNPQCHAALPAC